MCQATNLSLSKDGFDFPKDYNSYNDYDLGWWFPKLNCGATKECNVDQHHHAMFFNSIKFGPMWIIFFKVWSIEVVILKP